MTTQKLKTSLMVIIMATPLQATIGIPTKINDIIYCEILVQIARLLDQIIPVCARTTPPTASQIKTLEENLIALESIIVNKLHEKVDGTPRTRGILTPKLHKLLSHTTEWLKWWGALGMWSEQSIEVNKFIYIIVQVYIGIQPIVFNNNNLFTKFFVS